VRQAPAFWAGANHERVVTVERHVHEADLAWGLALAAKPCLDAVERNDIFVAIGAGDTFTAIGKLLKSVAIKRIPLGPDLVRRCMLWLLAYAGHEDERHLRRLIEGVSQRTGIVMEFYAAEFGSRLRGGPCMSASGVLKARRFPLSDGVPVEVVETGPSIPGRVVALTSRLTIKPALAVGSYIPHLPWPFGIVDFACRALIPAPGAVRTTVTLPTATAQLVRAPGVLPADGSRRVVLYLRGGAFLTCGANSHSGVVNAISQYADSPVLVVNYRLIPKHSVRMALDDCHDAYRWLRLRSYEPEQIVLAGDSGGGYLALALAQRLQEEGEEPAALVAISPLLPLAKQPTRSHPNFKTDAMFPPKAFNALAALVARAAANNMVDGEPEELYEPLDHVAPGLPRTLIHVSGGEVLLHHARLAARRLAAAGVPAEVRIWPGQIHDFQLAAPVVPEATRSLRQIGEYIRAATPRIMSSWGHFQSRAHPRVTRPLPRSIAEAQ